MAAGVRFTKAERDFIRQATGITRTPKEEKLRTSIIDKLDVSEMVKGAGQAAGIGWRAAVGAMTTVLGPNLAVPQHPAVSWMAWMSNRIRALGLTEEDCRTLAKVALAKGWRPPISFETLIKGADRYLAEDTTTTPKATTKAPLKMEDM